jgi:2-dehydro-3-deoxyphosphogluconate aldolase/(4S)-4-hydroxy-2-oxoglutarate aldolase
LPTVEPTEAPAWLAERLRSARVVPVVELPDAEKAVPLVEALVAAGLPCVEITFRTAAAQAGLEAIRPRFPDVLVGAGTVLSLEQLEAAAGCDVDFVVSPGLNLALVEACRARGLAVLPGVCTPTDIELARSIELDLVKFFPAEAIGGVKLLRALCGPYRDLAFVPTGGIDASNLRSYLELSQVAACGGSWMVKPELLRAGNFDRVRELAAEAVAIAGTVE